MYNLTRQETSEILSISVRSVDRYIRSGKLRIKKDGKNILVNSEDVELIKNGGKQKKQVIIGTDNSQKEETNREEQQNEKTSLSTGKEQKVLSHIYNDLKKEIEKKDDIIQNLAIRVGKAEEIAKNSISINDFKKSQLLLEESKSAVVSKLEESDESRKKAENRLKYERQINILLLIVAIFLFCILFVVWFGGI